MVRVWSRLARGGESLAGGDRYVENMTDNTTSMCSLISVYPKLFIPRAIAKVTPEVLGFGFNVNVLAVL